jgi:ATP-binding cassette subfamily B (MDR/TAP) protein 1
VWGKQLVWDCCLIAPRSPPLTLPPRFVLAFLSISLFAALDSESEAVVQASIDRLLEQGVPGGEGGVHASRTTVIVAHRLSTIKKADIVFVLDKGVVAESGTHDELLTRPGGLFARMVAAQNAGMGARRNSAPGSRRASVVSA